MTEPSQSLVGRLREGTLISTDVTPAFTIVGLDGEATEVGPSVSETRVMHPLGDEAADRITYLETRLEVVPGLGESADGISSRDATIALQDKRIAELEGEVGRLREALVRVEARLRPHPEDDTPADDRRYRHTAHSIARAAFNRMPLPSPPATSGESGG